MIITDDQFRYNSTGGESSARELKQSDMNWARIRQHLLLAAACGRAWKEWSIHPQRSTVRFRNGMGLFRCWFHNRKLLESECLFKSYSGQGCVLG